MWVLFLLKLIHVKSWPSLNQSYGKFEEKNWCRIADLCQTSFLGGKRWLSTKKGKVYFMIAISGASFY